MALSDRILAEDEESAVAVFEALILTGIGMSFTKTSRPASGTEHIVSHFWECKKLLEGKISDFHGKKVGVATLLILKVYGELYKKVSVKCKKEQIDWEDVFENYGALQEEVKRLNFPTTITDGIDPKTIENNWQKIREIIASVPDYQTVYDKMKEAGCPLTASEIAVSKELEIQGMKYHPYMRRRLSLYRLMNMIEG